VELSDDAAAGLLAREQEAYAARQSVQDALARARGAQPGDPAMVRELEAQLAAAEKEHADALAAIAARGDQLAALVPGRSAVLKLADVQALLDEQTTLVSYYVLGDKGALAFIITQEDLSVVELPEATPANLRAALVDLYQWLNLDNPQSLPLRKLHAWLIAPLADHLRTPQVGIIPHWLLHYVPFPALTDGTTHFGQERVLFNLPSASALPFIRADATRTPDSGGQPALIFGNPAAGDPSLRPLVYAAAEAKAVAERLGASVYTGAEASEARLRSGASGVGVVHLAAHGRYNVANPLYSAIYLAPSGKDDGRLETHEVYGLDLAAADLVVLSACQSNVGELTTGDELVGLTRAFFFAGAPTVVASLWAVDDEATGALMVRFYTHLQEGKGKAEALQAAQADIRSDPAHPQWAHPYYWAAFVLSGDPGQMPSPANATPSPAPAPTMASAQVEPSPKPTPAPGVGAGWAWVLAVALAVGLIAMAFLIHGRSRRR
jgi:CHAT domain-containing protein